ncbi:hypothetical protein [Pigmentiphaga litoralis]|uniref:hypothetical protein n=1 Tax=Pigmentiphaga litoralis TaxID=516702 RepID=UPI003B43343C
MGAITDADPAAVRLAFERGLVPLLGKGKTDLADGHAAVRQQLDAFYARWGVDGYRLVRVPPDRRAGGRHDDDTILLLDLTYLHAPLFPGIRQVLRHGVPASGADAYTNAARQAGLVVIRRDMAMPMQAQTMRHRWKSDGGSGTMPR